MESFVKADAIRSEDYLRKGLLYKSMAVSCFQVLDFPRAESYNDMAKNCYRLAGNTDKYAGAVLLSSDLHYIQEEYQEAIECLDSVKNMLNDISLPRRNEYYIRILRIKQDGQDNSGLSYELENYLSSFKKEDISWLDVADCYTCLGQYDLSSSALEQYRNNNSGYKRDPSYYISSYMLNDSLRNYKAALDDYINYSHLSDSLTLLIAEQDTEYIQEHYEKDMQIRKERDIRLMTVFLSISSIIILSCIIYIFRLRLRQSRKESEFLTAEISQYKENYDILSRERNELSRMIADNPPIDRGSMTVLNDRLELLNNFFTAAITSNSEIDIKACNKLKNLVENRKEFLYTTRMTFIAAHPKFIRHLESKGLTENEIEYCCLYVIGLKGKEIGEYINRASHYNESSDIRAKLGLGKHDTNLSNYLKNLLM